LITTDISGGGHVSALTDIAVASLQMTSLSSTMSSTLKAAARPAHWLSIAPKS
jgi:hypothetical protein